ncbi:MAG: hypothetical protein IKU42_01650 [Oscillospiraceae bacterium]|nr:hypothetical protein [Oscillospiraceae bacterium]
MDKLWIVLLFLCVFFIGNGMIKRLFVRYMSSGKAEDINFVSAEDKEDPKIYWEKSGNRREPENAEFVLPDEDFFENEKLEFYQNFEDEFSGLSDEEKEKILHEAELYSEEGKDF